MSGATSGAKPTSRRRERDLRVPVRPKEAQVIEAQARAVGMTIAAYLRAVGTGYQRAVVDRDQVDEMLRVNGDLGRLGGLLKLWLSDDAKLAAFDRGQIRQVILSALRRIEEIRQSCAPSFGAPSATEASRDSEGGRDAVHGRQLWRAALVPHG